MVNLTGNHEVKEKNMEQDVTLDRKTVDKLKKSIKNQGLMNPIMVNQKLEIIDGRHRLKACEELGVAVKYTFL